MANYQDNELQVLAQTKTGIDQARTKIKARLQPIIDHVFTLDCFDNALNLHRLDVEYESRSSPFFDLYADLLSIDGVTVTATWADEGDDYEKHYLWNNEGSEYEVIAINPWRQRREDEINQAVDDRIYNFIARLKSQRDGCEQTIKVLQKSFGEKLPF